MDLCRQKGYTRQRPFSLFPTHGHRPKGDNALARTNYRFEKRQKEIARQKKKEEKRQQKLNKSRPESREDQQQPQAGETAE